MSKIRFYALKIDKYDRFWQKYTNGGPQVPHLGGHTYENSGTIHGRPFLIVLESFEVVNAFYLNLIHQKCLFSQFDPLGPPGTPLLDPQSGGNC